MTFFRCPNDGNFGNARCSGTPEFDGSFIPTKEGRDIQALFTNARCKLDNTTCGKYLKIEDVIDLNAPWLNKPTFKETIVTPAGEKKIVIEGTNLNKKKSKSKIEEEKETKQTSMFA
jgi:hypothetical protein